MDGHDTIVLTGAGYGSRSTRDWVAKGAMSLVMTTKQRRNTWLDIHALKKRDAVTLPKRIRKFFVTQNIRTHTAVHILVESALI
ncbi:hypothetical protein Tco_0598680 [Tanacetum coccineum]